MNINSIIHQQFESEKLVSFKTCPSGYFTCILTETELRVVNSKNLKDSPLTLFQLDSKNFKKWGENIWMSWVNDTSLLFLTRNSACFFISLNQCGTLIGSTHLNIESRITAHTYSSGYFGFATEGPKVHFISGSGNFVGTLNFHEDITEEIISMRYYQKIMFFVFKDGTVGMSLVKFSPAFDSKEINVAKLNFCNVTDIDVSPDNAFIVLHHTNNDLTLLFATPTKASERMICRNCIKYTWCSQSSILFVLTKDNEISIINIENNTTTTTKLDFEFNINECHMTYDLNYISLMIADNSYLHRLYLATPDWLVPSLVMHTYDKIFFAQNDKVIECPHEVLSKGFTVQCAAATDNGRHVIIACIRGFGLYTTTTGQWIFASERFNTCESIWYQEGFFVTIVHDLKTKKRRIVLQAPETLTAVDSYGLPGSVYYASYNHAKIIIATKKSLVVFLISKRKLKEIAQFPMSCKIMGAYFSNENSLLTLINTDVVNISTGEVFKNDVISMVPSPRSSILFINYGDKQEFYFRGVSGEINIKPFFINGVFAYIKPKHYKVGSFKLKRTPFVAKVLFRIKNTDDKYMCIRYFLKEEYVLLELVRAYKMFIDSNRVTEFNNFIDRFELIKNNILVAALAILPEEYSPRIKSMLPNIDSLKREFPYYVDKLEQLYQV